MKTWQELFVSRCSIRPHSFSDGKVNPIEFRNALNDATFVDVDQNSRHFLNHPHLSNLSASQISKNMTIYSLSKRQALTIGLQLSVFEWNLAILFGYIV
jgi:hypothetical protein